MSRTLIALIASLATALVVSTATVLAVGGDTSHIDSLGYSRACTMATSPWASVATSNLAAAYTAALTNGPARPHQARDGARDARVHRRLRELRHERAQRLVEHPILGSRPEGLPRAAGLHAGPVGVPDRPPVPMR